MFTSEEMLAQLSHGCLVLSLTPRYNASGFAQSQQPVLDYAASQLVGKNSLLGVIIDFSALAAIDSHSFNKLRQLAQMLKLMGAEVIIAGLQAGVAASLVDLSESLEEIPAFANMEKAYAYLTQKSKTRKAALSPGSDDE
jgi:rsbT antagonist protein RsbS